MDCILNNWASESTSAIIIKAATNSRWKETVNSKSLKEAVTKNRLKEAITNNRLN